MNVTIASHFWWSSLFAKQGWGRGDPADGNSRNVSIKQKQIWVKASNNCGFTNPQDIILLSCHLWSFLNKLTSPNSGFKACLTHKTPNNSPTFTSNLQLHACWHTPQGVKVKILLSAVNMCLIFTKLVLRQCLPRMPGAERMHSEGPCRWCKLH